MFKKKIIMLMGATIVATAITAGITYAWFTSEKTSASAVITTGKLDIDFVLDTIQPTGQPVALYPQLTVYENGIIRPVIEKDSEYPDVAKKTYTLTNKSDRHVLVRIDAAALLEKDAVVGSLLDTNGYVIYDDNGDFIEDVLDNTHAVLFYYEVDGNGVETATIGNNAYVYLPVDAKAVVTLSVWIDGDRGGNEYQNAMISFDGLTAKATQYRGAAIKSTFGLNDNNLADIFDITGVLYE